MQFSHKLMPDVKRICASVQITYRSRIIVANPYRGRIIRCITTEPAILLITGRSGLTGACHIAELLAGCGTAHQNPLEDIRHRFRCLRLVNLLLLCELIHIDDHIAVVICNLLDTGWIAELSVVGKCRIGRCHLYGACSIGQSTKGCRRHIVTVNDLGEIHLLDIAEAYRRCHLLK